MNTSTHITCPGCNKQFARPAVSEPKNVRCKQCGTSFQIVPDEIVVAEVINLASKQPAQPSSLFPTDPLPQGGSLFPTDPYSAAYDAEASARPSAAPPKPAPTNGRLFLVLGVILSVVFLVAIVVAGLIWFWYSLSQQPQIAQNGPNNQVIDSQTFQPLPRSQTHPQIQPQTPQQTQTQPRQPRTSQPQHQPASTTPEQNAAAAFEQRRKEAQKKIDKARERIANNNSSSAGNSSTLSPKRITANVGESEALPQNVAASFGDMGWGISSMVFCPNNNFLVCGHSDRKLAVYDVEHGRRVELIEKLDDLGQIKAIAITPDGSRVLTGGYSGKIAIWSIDDRGLLEQVGEFNQHSVEIKSMAIDPTGQYVISGDRDKTARLWNLETQTEIAVAKDFNYHVVGAGFTDNGKTAVACCGKSIAFIDVDNGRIIRREEKYRKGSIAHDIAFSPDGTQFAVSDGYEIQVFDTETLGPNGAMKSKNHINWVLRYSSDGKQIISGQSGISIWDVDSLLPLGEVEIGKHINVQAIAISPNGQLISGIGAGAGKTLQVYKNPLLEEDSSPQKRDSNDE